MDNQDTHILVCDDEIDVREMLQEYLSKRGYRVSAASGGEELRAIISAEAVDVMIMDINMPKEDGLAILRSLRPENTTPVIMLTAAGDVVDRIIGLEMGADDYLGKPVDLRELEARIKAILRRGAIAEPASVANDSDGARFGDYTLNNEAAKLLAPDGSEVQLTAMEYRLLKVFADNKGRVLNRDQLLEQAHDRSWDPFDRSIDIRISRLRRKLESNPEKPEIIRTVRGIGYLYDPK
ncbi:two component transcriptional regulator, winged helix family [Ruegeria halocynthiae]|uniref:Regulatory protein VirG n=1 Tax=Ruegeria halocynthiae TaxID=985054 RepID=A0A1H3EUA2_9RHOB|nr:response regulator [Ruegeria halocynthiae]SDX82362.1 two component transcriptional regulator, winged helix family [Ruegeria halocynthiae]